jgi:glucuronoarabinoxylan endo-1,4-beta-xylanase
VTVSSSVRLVGLLFLLSLLASACQPNNDPRSDSQTNWLRSCQVDSQCGGSLTCLCGTCTQVCNSDATCAGLPGSSCMSADAPGPIALCGGYEPGSGMCLPSCVDAACGPGQMCVAQVCAPLPTPTAAVTVDTGTHFQVLQGLGATVGYAEDEITEHPRKAALYQAMFADLGLSVLRFRDRYGNPGDDSLLSATEITREAVQSLGHNPMILLTSWSPPAILKANAALWCQGNLDSCTLAQAPGGGFNYAGYAAYWRSSLDAYAAVGITPDYIGIQNNPDWAPSSAELNEACRFTPTESTQTVPVNGVNEQVRYPGFNEALTAVLGNLDGLATVPKVIAPEVTSANVVADYVNTLDFSHVDAIAHHLYGTDPNALDTTSLQALDTLAVEYDRPLFQTEMQADGFGTAVLLHDALTIENAAIYVQTALIGPASSPNVNPTALITLSPTDFTLEAPYYAMRHYSFFTQPGWVRVQASSDTPQLLSSGWLSPAADALTIVLVNTGSSALAVQLNSGQGSWATSRVVRTVFDGVERSVELGSLTSENVVALPGRSIVTVAQHN